MQKQLILEYLNSRKTALAELTAAKELHDSIRDQSGTFYRSILADSHAHLTHRAAVFVQLVRDQTVTAAEISLLMADMSAVNVLSVIDVLRTHRLNGRQASQKALRIILGREDFAEMAAFHRQRTRRLLKHLLGERTWSTVVRILSETAEESVEKSDEQTVIDTRNAELPNQRQRFLNRSILRFSDSNPQVLAALRFVAGIGFTKPQRKRKQESRLNIPWLSVTTPRLETLYGASKALKQSATARRSVEAGRGIPKATLLGIHSVYFPDLSAKKSIELAVTPNESSRNEVTESIKAALANNDTAFELIHGADSFERVDANVAIVLDMSVSMASSGERRNHPAAFGQAIVHQIRKSVKDVNLIVTGGTQHGNIFVPAGQSDIAMAVIEAAELNPDMIFVITDGFDNARQGDVATITQGMRALQIETPVVEVIPLFKATEDISARSLGENVPMVAMDNEIQTTELTALSHLAILPEDVSQANVETFCRLSLRA